MIRSGSDIGGVPCKEFLGSTPTGVRYSELIRGKPDRCGLHRTLTSASALSVGRIRSEEIFRAGVRVDCRILLLFFPTTDELNFDDEIFR